MQKWEYLFVGVAWRDLEDPAKWQPKHSTEVGGELPGWRQLQLPTYVSQLGDDGWELVTVVPPNTGAQSTQNPVLVFKRPQESFNQL